MTVDAAREACGLATMRKEPRMEFSEDFPMQAPIARAIGRAPAGKGCLMFRRPRL